MKQIKLIGILFVMLFFTHSLIVHSVKADSKPRSGSYASTLPGKLVYQEWGAKNGAPVIFIHGFPLDHRMWSDQVESIGKSFRMITYDLRGLGESYNPGGQYTLEILVDDLIALMDHLKIDQASVVGFSMGGYVALRAVERHPGRFKSLVLADTQSYPDSDAAKIKRTEALKTVHLKGVGAYASQFLKSAIAASSFQTRPDLIALLEGWIGSNSVEGVSSSLLALLSRTDTTESLVKFKIPTLILVGEEDSITPLAIAQQMKEKISGAKLAVISKAGHLSPVENPVEFNSYLLKFLNKPDAND